MERLLKIFRLDFDRFKAFRQKYFRTKRYFWDKLFSGKRISDQKNFWTKIISGQKRFDAVF